MHASAAPRQSPPPRTPPLLAGELLNSPQASSKRRRIELADLPIELQRRRLKRRQALIRAGQPMHSIYLVHAGQFKTCLVAADGREKVTGFFLRGDLLGIDSFGCEHHACDIVALDVCEVWELPCTQVGVLECQQPGLRLDLAQWMAGEIRRNWRWTLSLATLGAEQRVAAFLLDMAERQQSLGYSARVLNLRMTRAEMGNFLAIQLETATRALSHLASLGMIRVARRQIELLEPAALGALLRARRGSAAHPGGAASRFGEAGNA